MKTDDNFFELIPLYVNGTLSVDLKEAMEDAAEHDPKLAKEIKAQSLIRAALHEDVSPERVDVEAGWQRLKHDMAGASEPVIGGASNDNKVVPAFWRVAAAGLTAVVAAQFFALVSIDRGGETAIYETVGVEDNFAIAVTFAPEANLDDVTALLRGMSGEVVAGPSARGMYTLRFRTEEEKLSALEELQNYPMLVSEMGSR